MHVKTQILCSMRASTIQATLPPTDFSITVIPWTLISDSPIFSFPSLLSHRCPLDLAWPRTPRCLAPISGPKSLPWKTKSVFLPTRWFPSSYSQLQPTHLLSRSGLWPAVATCWVSSKTTSRQRKCQWMSMRKAR